MFYSDAMPMVGVRMDEELVERMDRLADAMSKASGGATVSRSNAIRTAAERGAEILEAELGVTPEPTKRRKGK